MNRNLPVKWWQRPQNWRYSRSSEGKIVSVASLMWSIWELMFPHQGISDGGLRRLQPSAEDAERAA